MASDNWQDFVRSNYKVMTVEHMAYILGVTRTEILQEFPMLGGPGPERSIQTIVVVRPRHD